MKQPHINCDEQDIQSRVIVCGDPAAVARIAELGTNPRHAIFQQSANLPSMKLYLITN